MQALTNSQARKMLGKVRGLGRVKAKKRGKYGNVKTKLDGVVHSSGKQGMRWVNLRQQEREGKIRNLRREVEYRLEVNGHLVCKYVADHVYEVFGEELPGIWTEVVEDVKSPITKKNRAYRIKLKLMRAVHDIDIREV